MVRVKRGLEYYLDVGFIKLYHCHITHLDVQAMENNGMKGNLKQPENFTTCGKLNVEIKQYNNPIEVKY